MDRERATLCFKKGEYHIEGQGLENTSKRPHSKVRLRDGPEQKELCPAFVCFLPLDRSLVVSWEEHSRDVLCRTGLWTCPE